MKKILITSIVILSAISANALTNKQAAALRIAADNTNDCIKYYAKTKNIKSMDDINKNTMMQKLVAYEINLNKLLGRTSNVEDVIKRLPKYRKLTSKETRCSNIANNPIKALNLSGNINTSKFNEDVNKTIETMQAESEAKK